MVVSLSFNLSYTNEPKLTSFFSFTIQGVNSVTQVSSAPFPSAVSSR